MGKDRYKKNGKTMVGAWLDGDELERVDAAARAVKNTRSGLVRLALALYLDERDERSAELKAEAR